jgi:hypothetical protein
LKTLPRNRSPEWYYEGHLLTEADGDTLIMKTSGRYKTRIQSDGCYTEASYDYIISDVEEDMPEFRVFPNPAGEVVYVKVSPSSIIKSIDVTNIAGQHMPLKFMHTEAGIVAVDLSSMSKGVYILKIQESKREHEIKLIK